MIQHFCAIALDYQNGIFSGADKIGAEDGRAADDRSGLRRVAPGRLQYAGRGGVSRSGVARRSIGLTGSEPPAAQDAGGGAIHAPPGQPFQDKHVEHLPFR
ncbi:hypothetical protein [Rhizobium leguminosarum]|uniref:hypothetical protein n=1 Tax=Rhizobium leguminosarum TaxID=384 RepID=UPI0021BC0DF7|nr:hypothetical protein [Rhizobium leguminosarum]